MDVPFPLRGLGEALSKKEKRLDRTRLMRNVWARDARTGETRGASRCGLVRISEAPMCGGNRIQALAPVTWPTPPYDYVELTGDAQLHVVPERIEPVWNRPLEELALDTQRGSDGSIFTLLEGGAVAVHSEKGELVEVIASYTPQGMEVVPDLRVDERGGLLVCSSTDSVVPGGSTVITRLARQDEEWRVDWQESVDLSAVAMDYRPGVVAVVGPEPGSDGESPDILARVSGILEGVPNVDWAVRVPQPAVDVCFDRLGGVIASAPGNGSRARDPEDGFGEPVISWVPYELREWRERLRSFFRPASPTVAGVARLEGDAIAILEDLRVVDTGFGEPPEDGRDLVQAGTLKPGPTYKETVGGGIGAARFVDDRALVSAQVTGPDDETAVLLADGESFAFSHAWVLQPSSVTRRLLTHVGGPGQAAVYLEYGGATNPKRVRASIGAQKITVGDFDDSGFCLLTVVWDKARGLLTFRLGGAHKAEFATTEMEFGGSFEVALGVMSRGSRTLLGTARDPSRSVNLLSAASANVQPLGTNTVFSSFFNSFNGQTSNSYRFSPGTPGFSVDFGQDVRIDEFFVWWRRSPNMPTFTIRAADDELMTQGLEEVTFEPSRDETQLHAQIFALFEITGEHRYWEFEGDMGSTGYMDVADARFQQTYSRRAEPADGDFTGWAAWDDPTYPIAQNGTGPVGSAVRDVTEVEAVEGYLAHDLGAGNMLVSDHPFHGDGNVPGGVGAPPGFGTGLAALYLPGALAIRFDGRGIFSWVEEHRAFGGRIATWEDYLVGASGKRVRRALLRSTGLEEGAETWEVQGPVGIKFTHPIAVDEAGDIYLAGPVNGASSSLARLARRDGSLKAVVDIGSRARGLVLGPDIPGPEAIRAAGALWAVVAGTNGEGSNGIQRFELVGKQRTGAPAPRDVGLVVVGCGELELYQASTGLQLYSSGTSGIDAARDVVAVEAFTELFLSDGTKEFVFRPRKRELVEFEPRGLGFGVGAPRLMCLWNGRIVKAGYEQNPLQWSMTAMGDPYDEDSRPPVDYIGRAVLGSLSPIGASPRPITALAAINDDMLLWGTDAAIYRLTGDPTQGGQLSLLSDGVGIAFGESIVKSPEGAAYFMASDGGVWGYTFGAGLRRVSHPWVEERLQETDLRVLKPLLRWSRAHRQLRVYLVRRDGLGPREPEDDGTRPPHFVWEQDTGGWSELTFGVGSIEPQEACSLDGDGAQDLLELMAGWDGRLRAWSSSATDDDGVPIDSEVEIGPLDARGAAVWSGLEVDLATEQGGAIATVLTGASADVRDRFGRVSRQLKPGANGRSVLRASGRYAFIRLKGIDGRTPWAFERASIDVSQKGRRRV